MAMAAITSAINSKIAFFIIKVKSYAKKQGAFQAFRKFWPQMVKTWWVMRGA
jgi:hypothetical protein